jgi:hypothetical protein
MVQDRLSRHLELDRGAWFFPKSASRFQVNDESGGERSRFEVRQTYWESRNVHLQREIQRGQPAFFQNRE